MSKLGWVVTIRTVSDREEVRPDTVERLAWAMSRPSPSWMGSWACPDSNYPPQLPPNSQHRSGNQLRSLYGLLYRFRKAGLGHGVYFSTEHLH